MPTLNQNQLMEFVDEFLAWEPHQDFFIQSLTVDTYDYYHLSYSRFFTASLQASHADFISMLDASSLHFIEVLERSFDSRDNSFADLFSAMQFYVRKCWMLEAVRTSRDFLPYNFRALDPNTLCVCAVYAFNFLHCKANHLYYPIGLISWQPAIFDELALALVNSRS